MRLKEASTESSYTSPVAKIPVPFSLVVAEAKSKKWPNFPTESLDQQDALGELLDLAIHLNEHLDEIGAGNLMAVSPNWLMSGSPSSPGSTGGPGAQPTPYKENTENQDYLFHSDFLPNMSEQNFSGELGEENVVVAILDTAPKLRDGENGETVLDRIHNEWARKRHLLIDSLLGAKRKLIKAYLDASVD